MINVPELNLQHYNILIAQEDWLYQILNYIIGRSRLRPFIIGLILNLQFHGGWLKLTRFKPNRLQDILFTGTGKKGDNYKFGPVVANSIKIWKTVERRIGGPFKFCNSTPLWHNLNLYVEIVHLSTLLVLFRCEHVRVICMITRASVHFRHWEPILSTSICHIFFSQLRSALKAYMAFLGLLPFPLILCGTGLHHLLVGICFLNI